MRAINHAMTGAIIGLTISEPIVAIPIAVGSHFVLDAIPHFGEKSNSLTSRSFKPMLWIDAILCLCLVLVIGFTKPNNWILSIVCATVAAGVDFMQAPRYFQTIKSGKDIKPKGHINRFHANIQWFQRPLGAVVEIAWAIGSLIILSWLIKK